MDFENFFEAGLGQWLQDPLMLKLANCREMQHKKKREKCKSVMFRQALFENAVVATVQFTFYKRYFDAFGWNEGSQTGL